MTVHLSILCCYSYYISTCVVDKNKINIIQQGAVINWKNSHTATDCDSFEH